MLFLLCSDTKWESAEAQQQDFFTHTCGFSRMLLLTESPLKIMKLNAKNLLGWFFENLFHVDGKPRLRHHHADLLTSLLGILNRGRCNEQYVNTFIINTSLKK